MNTGTAAHCVRHCFAPGYILWGQPVTAPIRPCQCSVSLLHCRYRKCIITSFPSLLLRPRPRNNASAPRSRPPGIWKTFGPCYIWAPLCMDAVVFVRRYICWPFYLGGVRFGRHYICASLHFTPGLATLTFWGPLHLGAARFGRRYI